MVSTKQSSTKQSLAKRTLFDRPTIAQLKHLTRSRCDGVEDTLDAMLTHGSDAGVYYEMNQELSENIPVRWYKKHLPTMDITGRPGSTPRQQLNAAIAHNGDYQVSGYSWRDGETTKVVPLHQLLLAAKLFAYEKQKPEDDVTVYDAVDDVMSAVVKVSSKTPKHPSRLVRLDNIPAENDSPWMGVCASTCCENNLYANLRLFKGDERKRDVFCAHGIAAYWKVAAHEYALGIKGPAVLSPFAYPSQEFVDFYKGLDRLIVSTSDGVKLADDQHQEMLLQAYAAHVTPAVAFRSRGRLADRDWS